MYVQKHSETLFQELYMFLVMATNDGLNNAFDILSEDIRLRTIAMA